MKIVQRLRFQDKEACGYAEHFNDLLRWSVRGKFAGIKFGAQPFNRFRGKADGSRHHGAAIELTDRQIDRQVLVEDQSAIAVN